MYQDMNEFLLLPLIEFSLMGLTFSVLIIWSYIIKQADFLLQNANFLNKISNREKNFLRIFMGTVISK